MSSSKLVYDIEYGGTHYLTPNSADVVVELEAIARDVVDGDPEVVTITIRYATTSELDALPEFDGF